MMPPTPDAAASRSAGADACRRRRSRDVEITAAAGRGDRASSAPSAARPTRRSASASAAAAAPASPTSSSSPTSRVATDKVFAASRRHASSSTRRASSTCGGMQLDFVTRHDGPRLQVQQPERQGRVRLRRVRHSSDLTSDARDVAEVTTPIRSRCSACRRGSTSTSRRARDARSASAAARCTPTGSPAPRRPSGARRWRGPRALNDAYQVLATRMPRAESLLAPRRRRRSATTSGSIRRS